MKIISQEYSIEEHDSVIGQIIMVLILQILNVVTQEFKCENREILDTDRGSVQTIDTSGMEFEVRAAGSLYQNCSIA